MHTCTCFLVANAETERERERERKRERERERERERDGICHTPHQAYKCNTRSFFWWIRAQDRSPHAPGGSKNASGPVGIPLKKCASGVSCRNFVKELMILFHRTAAAPWGHVAPIIKKSSTGDSSSFSTPTAVRRRSIFVAALDGIRIWYLPPPGTQERRTHVQSLKEQDTQTVKFLQTPYLHQTYQT